MREGDRRPRRPEGGAGAVWIGVGSQSPSTPSIKSGAVVFLARDSIEYMLSALYAIARPSVRHRDKSVKNG